MRTPQGPKPSLGNPALTLTTDVSAVIRNQKGSTSYPKLL